MKYTADTELKRSSKFIEAEMDGEIALMNHETGEFYSLADTALSAWKLIQDKVVVNEIVTSLSREYEVDPDTCLKDIQSMLVDLETGGLIEVVGKKPI